MIVFSYISLYWLSFVRIFSIRTFWPLALNAYVLFIRTAFLRRRYLMCNTYTTVMAQKDRVLYLVVSNCPDHLEFQSICLHNIMHNKIRNTIINYILFLFFYTIKWFCVVYYNNILNRSNIYSTMYLYIYIYIKFII